MDRILIRGGRALSGSIPIGGAKNAALPILAAGLLTAEPLVLRNVPALADIDSMRRLLATLGAEITEAAGEAGCAADRDAGGRQHARRLRSGAQDARLGAGARAAARARWRGQGVAAGRLRDRAAPGRPASQGPRGARRADRAREGYIQARAPKGLKGARIRLELPSVGATENLLMAAMLADGETVIANAAREPEIADLAACLVAMGARIEGIGSGTLDGPGRAAPAWRRAQRAARPHRARHLRDRRGDHRRHGSSCRAAGSR